MKLKRILAIIVVLVLAMILAACGRDAATPAEDEADAPPTVEDTTDQAEADDPVVDDTPVEVGDREAYTFRFHQSYTWANPAEWGSDVVTAYWRDMFNIDIEWSTPDAIADEVLNLMIIAGDLPCAIWMDRSPMNMDMARQGLFVPIAEMDAMVPYNWYHENIGRMTYDMLAIDGVTYIIPNWARRGEAGGSSTGGNMAWMITTNVHDAVGNPPLTTFEELFEYAVMVRDAGLTNHAGASIIPMLQDGLGSQGVDFVNAIYRSFGGVVDGWWYGIQQDGTFGSNWDNPLWIEAVLEANRWVRYDLYPVTNLTDVGDQFLANLNQGRGGLIWYDHSQDEGNSFRRILRADDPGNSIELITVQDAGRTWLYPPARGLPASRINPEHHNSLGWNGTFITRQAERPERIFELMTWLLTPMGSIQAMYGPEGHLWEGLDANGFPQMLVPPATLTPMEIEELGLWNWMLAGHSDNVDTIKFAVNNAQPEDYRSWVETIQYSLFTPNLRLTNEFVLLALTIEPLEHLGIQRTLIHDHFLEMIPQILMADSRDEAMTMIEGVRAFAEAQGYDQIMARYRERYEYNLALQGGSIFDPPPMP